MGDCKDLLSGWLRQAGGDLRRKSAEIQRQIDNCKTEWWPSQLAVLRDAHMKAAEAYDDALRTTAPDSRAPLPITSGSNEQSPDEARDAARYRWLRSVVSILDYGAHAEFGVRLVPPCDERTCAEQLDAAIDAAIAEQDGRKG